MRYSFLLIILLLTSILHAGQKPTVEELQRKVELAHGGKKADLLLQLAHGQLEQVDNLYHDGNSEKAFNLLKEAGSNADQATSISLDSGKRLKDTEIQLRKLSQRLQAMRQEASFEDRKPFDICIQNLEQDRSKLLDRMFKK
jgi:hypothetical protein